MRPLRLPSSAAGLLAVGLCLAPARAVAQAPSSEAPTNISLAEQLFQDARELVKQGNHEAACPKFEASLRLDPRAVGTTLNLAQCKEATGRFASAWGLYREVATRSRDVRPDRVEVATAKEKELFPRLSFLVIEAPKERPPGFVVQLDGVVIDRGAWGTALPVDGGPHTISARADGYRPYDATVEVGRELDRKMHIVPALVLAPKPVAPSQQLTIVEAPRPVNKTLAFALLGVGGAALGVGAVFGVDVLARSGAPGEACPSPCIRGSAAADESQRRYDALDREALAATVLIPAGAAVALAGTIFLLWSGETRSRPSPSGAGLGARF